MGRPVTVLATGPATGPATLLVALSCVLLASCASTRARDRGQDLAGLRTLPSGEALTELILSYPSEPEALTALERIDDVRDLEMLARESTSPMIRAAATEKIADPPTLAALATEANDPDVRRAAIRSIESQAVLAQIASEASNEAVAAEALRRVEDERIREIIALENPRLVGRVIRRVSDPETIARLLVAGNLERSRAAAELERLTTDRARLIVVQGGRAALAQDAVAQLQDPASLASVALEHPRSDTRLAALDRLDDDAWLERVATESEQRRVRMRAIERIRDSGVLARIARDADSTEERVAAVGGLENARALAAFATGDRDVDVRLAALEKLKSDETLRRVALGDPVRAVRVRAVTRIESERVLERIAREDDTPGRVARLVLALRTPFFAESVRLRVSADEREREYPDGTMRGEVLLVELLSADEVLLRRKLRASFPEAFEVRGLLEAPLRVQNVLADLFAVLDPSAAELARLSRSGSVDVRLAILRHGAGSDVVRRLAREDASRDVRLAALRQISDASTLAEIACTDRDEDVAEKALRRIDRPKALERVALKAEIDAVRGKAVARVEDPDVLVRVALSDDRSENRIRAIRRITDVEVLTELTEYSDPAVRYNATASLANEAVLSRLEEAGGTRGRLAACRHALLDPVFVEVAGELRLEVQRDADETLYGLGPDARRIRGEWLLTSVFAGDELVVSHPWAMPQAISVDESADWLDVELSATLFVHRVVEALGVDRAGLERLAFDGGYHLSWAVVVHTADAELLSKVAEEHPNDAIRAHATQRLLGE